MYLINPCFTYQVNGEYEVAYPDFFIFQRNSLMIVHYQP